MQLAFFAFFCTFGLWPNLPFFFAFFAVFCRFPAHRAWRCNFWLDTVLAAPKMAPKSWLKMGAEGAEENYLATFCGNLGHFAGILYLCAGFCRVLPVFRHFFAVHFLRVRFAGFASLAEEPNWHRRRQKI